MQTIEAGTPAGSQDGDHATLRVEDQRLDVDHLASEAETTPERIRELVEIGAIAPAANGTFERGDVIRVRVVSAFEAEGFSLEQMARAIAERAIDLRSLPLFYPDPSPRTGRTFAEFTRELGPRGELAGSVLAAMGLSAPEPDEPTRGMEEQLLTALSRAGRPSRPCSRRSARSPSAAWSIR